MKIKTIKIVLILMLGLANAYFLLKILYLDQTASTNNKQPETTLVNDLKNLKQALDYLKTRELFPVEKMATSEASQKQKLTMEILNGSGITGKADSLKNNLAQLGLEITTGNTQATSSTAIKCKGTVSADTKTAIIAEIKKQSPQITEEVLANDYPSDIVVVLGKFSP